MYNDDKKSKYEEYRSTLKDDTYYKNVLIKLEKEIQILNKKEQDIREHLESRIRDLSVICQKNDTETVKLIERFDKEMARSRNEIKEQAEQIACLKRKAAINDEQAKTQTAMLESVHNTTMQMFKSIEMLTESMNMMRAMPNQHNTQQYYSSPPPPQQNNTSALASKVPATAWGGIILAALALLTFVITGDKSALDIIK